MTDSMNRRQALLGGAFLLTAGVAAARTPTHHIDLLGKGKIDALIPKKIGRWTFYSKSGLVVPPSDQLSDSLYAQLLTRVYTGDEGPAVMLLVAQSAGQTGILQVHRPEFCYPAGGFTLSDKVPHGVALPGSTLEATMLTATANDRIEQILYWTRVGDDMPTTWVKQRWSVARANLRGDIPDAVMVRVSVLTPDREMATRTLEEFTRAMFAAVPPKARRVLDISAV
jgi:EpsI family protein